MAKPNWVIYSSAPSPQHPNLYTTIQRANHYTRDNVHLPVSKMKLSSRHMWPSSGKVFTFVGSRRSFLVCQSTDTRNTETKEHLGHYGDCSNILRSQKGDEHPETAENISFSLGLAEACKYFSNGAKFVNERAKNQIVLLSRGIMKLDSRARKDVAFLGSEFLKIDARAREDTEKVNRYVKIKAERLHHVATILKNIAQSRLKSAADMHWSDGALEVDLKRAAKHHAMEDCLMALERIHLCGEKDYINTNEVPKHITLEKNGKTLGFFPGEVSTDHISAIQECYQSIASALSEADGIDYTDPEELELLVAALIDLDAMDGKSSVSLLAECSSSPDVSTRRALANALSAAPSLWTLGNAGMGALQRLAEDCDPAIAAASAKTIYKLKKQWEREEVDSWRFTMNQTSSIMSEDKAEDTGGTD